MTEQELEKYMEKYKDIVGGWKIILRGLPEYYPRGGSFRGYRVEYKIETSQLKWYERILFGGWHSIYEYHILGDNDLFCYTESEFEELKDKFNTVMDVYLFMEEEHAKHDKCKKKYIEQLNKKTLY